MKVIERALDGVAVIEPTRIFDERGWFMESYNSKQFNALVRDDIIFVQDNHSMSNCGTLRGLHYQLPPHEQVKLVRVVSGRVFDVVVDLRPKSKTFRQSFSIELSARDPKMLWVPSGFAHGFLALDDNTNLLYKTTSHYCKSSERSIRWDCRDLNINWPQVPQMFISKKDLSAPTLGSVPLKDLFL